MKRMLSLTEHVFERGISYCTLFALSQENLRRPQEELNGLYALFRTYFTEKIPVMKKKGITLRVIGDLSLLPSDIALLIRENVKKTEGGVRGTLCLAIGYGAQQDIVSACNRAVREGRELTVETLGEMLSTGGMPALDLLIRTGREKRISNFLLFEAAYAELYFSDKLFPDFTNRDLDRALEAYAKRERRYGQI